MTLTMAVVVAPGALSTVYIKERFRTGVRVPRFDLCYSLAVILPALLVFYRWALATIMPARYTVLVPVVVGIQVRAMPRQGRPPRRARNACAVIKRWHHSATPKEQQRRVESHMAPQAARAWP